LEQNYYFKSLFKSQPGLMWTKDLENKFVVVNDVFSNMVGVKKPELAIGKTDYDFWPEHLAKKYEIDDNEVLKTGKSVIIEEIVSDNGVDKWFEVFKAPAYNDNDELIGTIGYSSDICDRKRNEELLHKLSQAIEQSPVTIVITDLQGIIEYVNPKFCKITGYTYEEAIGQNPRILKSEALSNNHYKELWSTINAGKEWRGEFKNIKKNGEVYWEQAYISPIRNNNGEITHFIALKEDITELKVVTDLQHILMDMALKYINLKLSDIEPSINQSLHEIAKYVEADRALIFDFDWEKQISNNSYEWCDEGIESRINELQNIPLEEMNEWIEAHKKGEILEIPDVKYFDGFSKNILETKLVKSLISVPLMNNEQCIGFITFDSIHKNHNYTDKEKSLLLVFSQLIINLQQRLTIEKILIQEKENAQKANIAKSEFLANMSHELRTPLNGVIGFSELLVKSSLSDVQNQYANAINTSANILFAVINDILDFSKIESNKFELEYINIDIVKILEQSVDIIKFSGDKKGLEILLDIPANLPRYIKSDPVRLTQILANLLGNAVKFTQKGEIELKVEFVQGENNKGIINFYVRDTGIGISEEQTKKLFKAFSQADSSTTRKFGGTGLGLIISDLIAIKMGGKINFISEENVGTTFYFSIETNVEFDETIIENQINKSNLKCLIIEDNINNQLIIRKLLSKWEIETVCCDNGLDAVKILELDSSYDFIIVDYKMPLIDGIETIKLIKHKFPNLDDKLKFIILVSSLVDNGLYEISNLMGLDYHLTKPIKSHELYNCVNEIVNGRSIANTEVEIISTKAISANNKKNPRILIAEDDFFNMQLAKALISNIIPGVELIEALNGKIAVDLAKTEKPDLIFMDFQMPEMDGFEAIKLIRAREIEHNTNVPIIGLSASVMELEIDNGYASGMNLFLTKPIDTRKLRDILNKYFD